MVKFMEYVDTIVRRHYSIQALCLAENGLGVREAAKLANALKSSKCKIVSLDVSKNDLMDEGVVAIARALKNNKTVKTLNIKDTNCVSDGFKALVEIL